MCDINESIKGIVDQVLGPPKRDFSGSNGWYEYNCPCCAEERMGEPDGKYNLAIQIDETGLWGHCWKCGYHGNLSRIIKHYGTEDLLNEYNIELFYDRCSENTYIKYKDIDLRISIDDIANE